MVSQLKVNEIIKQSGSSITIGEAGDTITVPDDFIIKCGQHAESRGMTLEEYIIEAFEKIEAENKKVVFNQGQETLAGFDRPNSEDNRQT